MPDISLCNTIKCPKRYECTRYMAKPNKHAQSYMAYDHKKCDSFWPLNENYYEIFTKIIMIAIENDRISNGS